ncbi:MAG: cytochrome C [Betaproteobacteria bacterium]|nr:MAG: cytochrome C [Betaproteobacteria bacterium]
MNRIMLVAALTLAAGAGSAAAQSVTYENTVKDLVADRCGRCHGKSSPSFADFEKDKAQWKKKTKGPRFDSYAELMVLVKGTDAGALMRRLDDGKNTADGKPGNMYRQLGKTDEDRAQRLDVMKKWVGNWTLKRRNELSEAELSKISAVEK